MRKVLPILLAIAIAAPALADVTVSVAEGTAADQMAEISLAIDGGAVVRGLAITVTVTNGSIDAVADLQEVMAGFNAYIDYYYSNTGYLGTLADETELPGAVAHALADPDAAGVLDLAAPKSVFSISLGALDNSGAQGGVTAGGILAKIALTIPENESATVCIASDALRGGIVGDTLGTVTVDATCASIAGPVIPTHTVSTPNAPSILAGGYFVGQSLPATGSGAVCSDGHAVQYRFDWGDGSAFSAWGAATQSKSYATAGAAISMKVQARCATDNLIVSEWSAGTDFTVGSECQKFNASKRFASGTDNTLNATDLTNMVTYINTNRFSPTVFAVVTSNANYDPRRNFDATATINAADLTVIVNYINASRFSPTVFARVCPTPW